MIELATVQRSAVTLAALRLCRELEYHGITATPTRVITWRRCRSGSIWWSGVSTDLTACIIAGGPAGYPTVPGAGSTPGVPRALRRRVGDLQAAGGWYALRRGFLSRAYLERRDLSNVICEQHLDGLARRLAEERAREAPGAPPAGAL
jgi:hypothetical protein